MIRPNLITTQPLIILIGMSEKKAQAPTFVGKVNEDCFPSYKCLHLNNISEKI